MFARAGISSRVLRHGDQVGGFFGRPKKKKKPKQKFRCYVPFMWSTCVAICCGLAILCGGTAMCVTGYFARNFTSTEVSNGSHTWLEVDPIPYAIMWNMTYVGPVLMGCGCFTMVVACVVVCETRDKMVRIMEINEQQGRKTNIKPDFYDLVIKRLKKTPDIPPISIEAKQPTTSAGTTPSTSRRKSFFNLFSMRRSSLKSVKSTKSDFSHIGSALRKIPMEIFAIDMSQTQKMSLLPISLTLGLDIGRRKMPLFTRGDSDIFLVPKYPSASCIPDLLKLNDEKLDSLFPDLSSWLEESGHKSPLGAYQAKYHRQESYSRIRFGESRDADESDLDSSVCSVTVHVQHEARPRDIPNSDMPDDERYRLPPSAHRMPQNNPTKLSTLTNPNAWRTKATMNHKSADSSSMSESALFPSIEIHKPPMDERRPAKSMRRSLIRQKQVVEDSDSPQLDDENFDMSLGHGSSLGAMERGSYCDINPDNHPAHTMFHLGPRVLCDFEKRTEMPRRPPSLDGVPQILLDRMESKDSIGNADDLIKDNRPMDPLNVVYLDDDTGICEETNRLLDNEPEADTKHSSSDTSTTSVPAQNSLAQDEKDLKSSVFIPYNPKPSEARVNSVMSRTSSLVNSLTNVDRNVLSKVRSSHVTRMTSFTRNTLSRSSQFHFETEGVVRNQSSLRKSKTVENVNASS